MVLSSARTMWQLFCLMGTMGAIPYFLRRVEQRQAKNDGPYPSEWTMRMDAVPTYARPSQLERDLWAKKRSMLDVDVWAERRRGDIDKEEEKTYLMADEKRREKILSPTWGIVAPGASRN